MYNLSDATLAPVSRLYCMVTVILGSFFLLNLILAVISEAFDECNEETPEQVAAVKAAKAKEMAQYKELFEIVETEEEKEERFAQNALLAELEEKELDKTVEEIPEEFREQQMGWIQWVFFRACTHDSFTIIITIFSLANMVVLACDRYPLTKTQIDELNYYNDLFTWVFIGDMVIKMIGLGFKEYFVENFNKFDFLIIMFSVFEMLITALNIKIGGGAISALRALRLLRVFKLARSWKSFHNLL